MNRLEGWHTSRFDEFGTLLSGSTPSTAIRAFWDGDIVWVTPYDLSRLKSPYLDDTAKKITDKGLEGCSAQFLPPRSIVISSRAPIGYVAIPRVHFCTNQGCKSIKLKSGYDSEFAYYNILFNIEKVKTLGEGTTFAEISKSALSAIELDFPDSKPEQTKIAEILSTVDRAIEQTEALIAKQQRIKTGLLQDLLTRGIDEHDNLRSDESHKFKDSPAGRIPVEWESKQIAMVAKLQRGHDITEDELEEGPYPVVSSGGIVGYHKMSTSAGPNVVVGRKGTIGKVHYLPGDFWAHDTSLYVIDFQGNSPRFIYYLFSYLKLERFGTKSGSPSLNRNDVHPIRAGMPPFREQEAIAEMLDAHEQHIDRTLAQRTKLLRHKTALMQDLLTGKKRVTPLLEPQDATVQTP